MPPYNQYPCTGVCADGYRLGKWISNQRCAYMGIATKRLTEKQIRRLEEIGMVWSVGQCQLANAPFLLPARWCCSQTPSFFPFPAV